MKIDCMLKASQLTVRISMIEKIPGDNMDWLADPELQKAASALADILEKRDLKIVFAESCTAGLVSASLGRIPGISRYLAGSAVTYQIATKDQWLDPDFEIDDGNVVSQQTAEMMARQILEQTPHADVATAVTGHLGPNAEPAQLDGVIWVSCLCRGQPVASRKFQLESQSPSPSNASSNELRWLRQSEAARHLIEFVTSQLNSGPEISSS